MRRNGAREDELGAARRDILVLESVLKQDAGANVILGVAHREALKRKEDKLTNKTVENTHTHT